jgi:hypothetical protein
LRATCRPQRPTLTTARPRRSPPGDSAVYYPAGGTSGLFIFQRAGISAPEIFRFGLVMTLVAISVLLVLVVPYWNLVGQPLVR